MCSFAPSFVPMPQAWRRYFKNSTHLCSPKILWTVVVPGTSRRGSSHCCVTTAISLPSLPPTLTIQVALSPEMLGSPEAFVARRINSGTDAYIGAVKGRSCDSISSPAQTLSLSAVIKNDADVEVIGIAFACFTLLNREGRNRA